MRNIIWCIYRWHHGNQKELSKITNFFSYEIGSSAWFLLDSKLTESSGFIFHLQYPTYKKIHWYFFKTSQLENTCNFSLLSSFYCPLLIAFSLLCFFFVVFIFCQFSIFIYHIYLSPVSCFIFWSVRKSSYLKFIANFFWQCDHKLQGVLWQMSKNSCSLQLCTSITLSSPLFHNVVPQLQPNEKHTIHVHWIFVLVCPKFLLDKGSWSMTYMTHDVHGISFQQCLWFSSYLYLFYL